MKGLSTGQKTAFFDRVVGREGASVLDWADLDRIQVELPSLKWIQPDPFWVAAQKLLSTYSEVISCTELGKSFEGRPIRRLSLGSGKKRVLLWSQMHGDEPTHTEVLLRLLAFLAGQPTHPSAQAILSKCELAIVPMLNPDGAHRDVRLNAQGIDINRDARRLQTPEGQLLHQLIVEWQPEFTFTLHNQNRRTAVRTGGPPATASLLVPPASPDTQDTHCMIVAKQVAVTFIDAVRPHCGEHLSRYDADYMPRCFGESIQSRNISTLLVEAGGTRTGDLHWLSNVHLLGLISALSAFAQGSHPKSETLRYDALPRSSAQRLFDCLVTAATVVSASEDRRFEVDIGINQEQGPFHAQPAGRIEDLGDLRMLGGLHTVDASRTVCRPGKICFAPDVDPQNLEALDWCELLESGVTTIVGVVPVGDESLCQALAEMPRDPQFPLNVAFVGCLAAQGESADLIELCLAVLAAGACGLLSRDAVLIDRLRRLGKRCFSADSWRASGPIVPDRALSQQVISALTLDRRGEIQRGCIADLTFGAERSNPRPASKAEIVMVNGAVVWQDGQLASADQGRLLLGDPWSPGSNIG